MTKINLALSDAELERYGRHVILPEIGEEKQAKLLQAKILAVGAGGLGSASLLYLAAAGIGTIGILDHDTVEIGNLQRQIIHGNNDVGRTKVQSAQESIHEINPNCKVNSYRNRLTKNNAPEFIKNYDLIIDGSDNFPARYALADACAIAKKPLVTAAVVRMEGQITLLKPYIKNAPCYHCIYPETPNVKAAARCNTVGILGPVAGLLGTCQAIEAIKEITQIGENLLNRLLMIDALSMRFYTIKIKKNPNCYFCNTIFT